MVCNSLGLWFRDNDNDKDKDKRNSPSSSTTPASQADAPAENSGDDVELSALSSCAINDGGASDGLDQGFDFST